MTISPRHLPHDGKATYEIWIGSFSNDDGNGNEDVKKAIGLLRKTTTLHVHHAFLYISLPSLHDYDVKMPNCKFYGGRKQATTNLFSVSKLECGPQEINSMEIRLHLPFSENWNKRNKDWKMGIHFKTDVFAAVAVVDAPSYMWTEALDGMVLVPVQNSIRFSVNIPY